MMGSTSCSKQVSIRRCRSLLWYVTGRSRACSRARRRLFKYGVSWRIYFLLHNGERAIGILNGSRAECSMGLYTSRAWRTGAALSCNMTYIQDNRMNVAQISIVYWHSLTGKPETTSVSIDGPNGTQPRYPWNISREWRPLHCNVWWVLWTCTSHPEVSHLKWYTMSWSLLTWTNHYHITSHQQCPW
jgi:hypothetical protein